MKEIYIVDAVNFLFRAYYAIGPLTNSTGESTNALYGLIRSLYKIIKDFSPTHLVAVFDGPENKRSREQIYEHYKKHRAGMPEDLFPQLEKALHFCELAGIPLLSITGVEADDTIGTITKWAERNGSKVFICSSDKDLCQLITSNVFVLNPHKDNLLIDQEKTKEIFGVTPEQIPDLLGLMGDASDNIPGLEGFGMKTAAALLQEHGTMEHILAHPDKISGQKRRQTIIDGKDIALMSKKLATIDVDVEVPKEIDFYELHPPKMQELREFFQKMNFMTLLRELESNSPNSDSIKDPGQETHYHCIDDAESLKALVQHLKQHPSICVDTETTDIKFMKANIVGIGFAVKPEEAWYVPMNGNLGKEQALAVLRPLLEDPNVSFYGHNIKYDIHVLLNEGISIKKVGFDTMLASYVLTPQNARHNLDDLSLDLFGKVKISIDSLIGKGKAAITMDQVPIEKVCAYCCEDVDYTCRLKSLFEKEIEKLDLSYVFYSIEIPLIMVLVAMERQGIFVDKEKLHSMSIELQQKILVLETKIYAIAGEEFNLNSPKQLSTILYEKLQINPPKKTQTGFSTSADVLESLKAESPIIKEILEYRTLEKLRSTYVESLPQQIYPKTGRIHCTFNQSVAATGRLSCQDPNLQNIPVRSLVGKEIRTAFLPEQSNWSFVSADYSQIELRLLAHLSEDPNLLKAFNEGEDVHAYTASLVFDVPLRDVTQEMRHKAKAVNFGILYGQQAFGLSQGLDIDYKEAAAFIDTYFQRYKKVREFLEHCKEAARTTGRAVTITGRQRPIPDILSKNPMIRSAAERLAINTPLQGTAADLIKLAMIRVQERILIEPTLGHLLLQIHDELILECPDYQVDKLSKIVKEIMEGVFDLKVPLSVEISIGKNWGEC